MAFTENVLRNGRPLISEKPDIHLMKWTQLVDIITPRPQHQNIITCMLALRGGRGDARGGVCVGVWVCVGVGGAGEGCGAGVFHSWNTEREKHAPMYLENSIQ